MNIENLNPLQLFYLGTAIVGVLTLIIHLIKRRNRKDDFERLDDLHLDD